MSMISSQCDELRDTAMRVEIFLEGSTDAIPMDTHEQLRHAANTIWELRCKLAGTVDQREEVERLKTENEKLRELCADMLEDEERGHNDDRTFREHVIRAHKHGIAKDIEV